MCDDQFDFETFSLLIEHLKKNRIQSPFYQNLSGQYKNKFSIESANTSTYNEIVPEKTKPVKAGGVKSGI
jgi:hypothetical protein